MVNDAVKTNKNILFDHISQEELKKTIDYIFKNKIKDEHLKNYFNYLFTQANDFINKNS